MGISFLSLQYPIAGQGHVNQTNTGTVLEAALMKFDRQGDRTTVNQTNFKTVSMAALRKFDRPGDRAMSIKPTLKLF